MKRHMFLVELPPLDGLRGFPLSQRWVSIERLLDRAIQAAHAGYVEAIMTTQSGDQDTEFDLSIEARDLPNALSLIQKVLRKKRVPEGMEFKLFEYDKDYRDTREIASSQVYEDHPWASSETAS